MIPDQHEEPRNGDGTDDMPGEQPAVRELLLAASVFQHSPQGIMITDAERRIRMVNSGVHPDYRLARSGGDGAAGCDAERGA